MTITRSRYHKRKNQTRRLRRLQRRQRPQHSRHRQGRPCPRFPRVFPLSSKTSATAATAATAAGTNFYKFVNHRWLATTHLKADDPETSVSSEMQDKVDSTLKQIIRRAQLSRNTPDQRAVAEFSDSFTSRTSQETALTTLKDLLGSVGCIKNIRDVCYKIGELTYAKSCNIVSIYDGPEERNAKHWRLHLGTGKLALPDAKYYLDDSTYESEVLIAYSEMLQKVGEKLGYDGLEKFAGMETDYAKTLQAADEEESKVYDGKDLPKAYADIHWDSFWEPFGDAASHWKNMRIVVDSPTWYGKIGKLLHAYSIDEWKLWFRAAYILCYLPLLPRNYSALYEEVFSEKLAGVTKEQTRDDKMLYYMKTYMSVPLSRLYISTIVDESYQKSMVAFMKKLLAATISRIESIEWMTASTKRTAVNKVKNIHLGILYPRRGTNYMTPTLGDNIIENMLLLGRSVTDQEIKDARKKYSTEAWDNPVYAVNAYYLAAGNRLIIPAAIAQWPFYCESASAGWNYGGLGAAMAHEITHAFDADGKNYDAAGNIRDWWTAADDRSYRRITRHLIAQFNQSELFGRKINGRLTLSENIADLGGVGIALEALLKDIIKRGVSEDDKKRELRDFFTAYAVSWREKEHKAHSLRQIISDVHAPPEFRVNNIVCHFDEWYFAFDINETAELYVAPEKRIRIF